MTITPVPKPGLSSIPFVRGLDAASLVTELVGAAQDWARIRETEITKRESIAAREHAVVSEIKTNREIILTYLNLSFDERERNFRDLFAALDSAMARGTGDVGLILGAITTLAAKSPFADLHDLTLVKAALDDPDHEWEV